ncbi:MAG: SIMPL domain-containing protein [Salegentibacter sp.]|uniref:SIMPL domain-containing protein n=1 Tax=Salegentibacter sp. TaxID=1903072 RepID=UPI00286FB0F0|nr:SIMPL domain-containing protein [Salegentibacter sp.]MDR9457484.1 SIMPL domain-containing protein [Salegentibacter sp.]
MKKLLLLTAILLSVGAFAQEDKMNQGIFVSGEGIVKVVPDQVVIKSQIEHEGVNANTVKKENDQTADAILKYLKSQDIPEKNIQTDYVNLNKRYNYNDKSYTYVARQAISITLEDLDKYEEIISGLLENGLNGISGIQFKSSEVEIHKTEARKRAVLAAKRKAEEFAGPLNQEVGKAITISESSGNNFQPVYRMADMKMSEESGSQETLSPGEMEIRVKVNVGFQLH